jgi:hypothetical protein
MLQENIIRGLIGESFSGPKVQFVGKNLAFVLCELKHGCALGRKLSNESICVLVRPAFVG